MDARRHRKLIETYRAGYQQVANALVGITDDELERRPAPGAWSPREIVHHLADSELVGSMRLRLLLAEDAPRMAAYDQDRYAERLHYQRAYTASLELFRALRASNAELLELLTPAEWARTGTHPEVGEYSVERWLEIYADHASRHAEQILRSRESLR